MVRIMSTLGKHLMENIYLRGRREHLLMSMPKMEIGWLLIMVMVTLIRIKDMSKEHHLQKKFYIKEQQRLT